MSIYAKLKAAKANFDVVKAKDVHFAVQGCCHGELDVIYKEIAEHDRISSDKKISFLICCGDFQAVRDNNGVDLSCMAVPDRYKTLGDFHKYFGENPEKVAPVLTIFIGGNHEASNFLMENYYGGFVAKNIYYLGSSGVINVHGLRIAGLSGIFKGRDYTKPYPIPPYRGENHENDIRSAYHVRRFEIAKLSLLQKPIDIFVSHDWPVGITKYGDEEQLLRFKPFFREDIEHGQLGNPNTLQLMKTLKPQYWFAAHLHCYFSAEVPHMTVTPDGKLDTSKKTTFIALDKCPCQKRPDPTFIEYFTLTPTEHEKKEEEGSAGNEDKKKNPSTSEITFDEEWINIIKFSHSSLLLGQARRGGKFYDDNCPVIVRAAELEAATAAGGTDGSVQDAIPKMTATSSGSVSFPLVANTTKELVNTLGLDFSTVLYSAASHSASRMQQNHQHHHQSNAQGRPSYHQQQPPPNTMNQEAPSFPASALPAPQQATMSGGGGGGSSGAPGTTNTAAADDGSDDDLMLMEDTTGMRE